MIRPFGPAIHKIALWCIATLYAVANLPALGADYALRWHKNEYVEVQGLSPATLDHLKNSQRSLAQWQRILSVHAEQGNLLTDLNLPAILGAYRVEGQTLQFHPRYPLEPGVSYRATFRPAGLPGGSSALTLSSSYQIPLPSTNSTTIVSAIHPSAEILPENILKFYIQFSAPMSGGRIYDHIHLRDASGQAVQLPFLEIDEELWNRDMTRLTLFLDPGRIKRGVQPLEEIGPALQAGQSYTLAISRDWRDAKGLPLKADFEKKFKVAGVDRDPPDPARWKISPPRSGKKLPLKVDFNEAMDHALAHRVLRVSDPSGFVVAGSVDLDPTDHEWRFTPDQPWKRGVHHLLVPTAIEDLAGNNIGKPFDVDLEQGARPLTNSLVRLPFTVK